MCQRKSKHICKLSVMANQRKVNIAVINEPDFKLYLRMLSLENESAATVGGICDKSNLFRMVAPTKL